MEEITEIWSKTFDTRRKILKESKLFEYFNPFPILKQENGYHFLLKDFDRLYPEKTGAFYEKWPNFKKAILHILNDKNIS